MDDTADWFPEGVLEPHKLRMTPEGVYSMTRRPEGQQLLRILRAELGDLRKLTITDATGNMGGDTILFGQHFDYVHSIELDPENLRALRSNVAAFGLQGKRVSVHAGDASKLWSRWRTDVLYVDPPWGGPGYKNARELDLHFGGQRLDVWLRNDVLGRNGWRPRAIVLKLPRNYAFWRLRDLGHMKRHAVRNFFIVVIAPTERN